MEEGRRRQGEGRTRRYAGSALKVALGVGTALVGSYVVARIRERQDSETSLGRLEQMLESLGGAEGNK